MPRCGVLYVFLSVCVFVLFTAKQWMKSIAGIKMSLLHVHVSRYDLVACPGRGM